jgi:Virulence factor
MAELTVIWWRDIPAQVIAKQGRSTAKAQLSERFQEAIDMAATRVGLIGTDEYLSQWRRDSRACGEDLDAEAAAEAHRLEQAYSDSLLESLVRAGGVGAEVDG